MGSRMLKRRGKAAALVRSVAMCMLRKSTARRRLFVSVTQLLHVQPQVD